MEEQEPKPHPVDSMTGAEFTKLLINRFGPRRSLELFGWVCLAGPIIEMGFKGDAGALRRELEKRGMTKSSIYRALTDIRTLGQELEEGVWPTGRGDHARTFALIGKMYNTRNR